MVKTYKPTASELNKATDELSEVIADLNANINPDTQPEAYNAMLLRVDKVQKILLGYYTPEQAKAFIEAMGT